MGFPRDPETRTVMVRIQWGGTQVFEKLDVIHTPSSTRLLEAHYKDPSFGDEDLPTIDSALIRRRCRHRCHRRHCLPPGRFVTSCDTFQCSQLLLTMTAGIQALTLCFTEVSVFEQLFRAVLRPVSARDERVTRPIATMCPHVVCVCIVTMRSPSMPAHTPR